ncbi:MAG: molybdopterin-dependent oxidoreductase [Deltaproteobacteria bacterium]|nr:molybdopterin-dependent oxidoreductase [Deltaproteobacteria bacterium]
MHNAALSRVSLEIPHVDKWIKAVCRYCGAGCGVYAGIIHGTGRLSPAPFSGKVIAVEGDRDNWNKGALCVKGHRLPAILYAEDRLKYPMLRRGGRFVRVSWKEAMDIMTERFAYAIKQGGTDAVAFYGSGQLCIEESYFMAKFFKGGLGANNIDANSRLCMASAAAGYIGTYGKDEPMGSYDDIFHADCFFIIGSNMAETHPVIFKLIEERKQTGKDIKIIVADPRKTITASAADLYMGLIPGSDAVILNAMQHVIVKENLYNKNFLENHVVFKAIRDNKTVNVTFEEYVKFLDEYTPETAEKLSGCRAEEIIKAALWFAASGATMSLWCMGINQRTSGVYLNNLMHNLHLLTGQICRPGATPLSLTGQPNACGGTRDAGLLSHLLPYGRFIANEKDRGDMEKFWGIPAGRINPKPGLSTIDIFHVFGKGDIKALWIACTNPGQSLPNLSSYRNGMGSKPGFLVVSDAYHPTRTTELADLVLPAALWIEKDGTYGQSERRYQYSEKVVEPPGEARSDLKIMMEFAGQLFHALGRDDEAKMLFPFKNSEDVWDEIRQASQGTTYDLMGMTRARLKKSHGLQWPCPEEGHPGTMRRYTAQYGDSLVRRLDTTASDISFYGAKEDGNRAAIWLRPYKAPAESPDSEYPFILTTGRQIDHWHTGTMTMKILELKLSSPDAYVEINPEDAARLRIKNNDRVRIASRRGFIILEAKVIDAPRKGVVFVPMHYSDRLINTLTTDAYDEISKQPEFKICAVRIEAAMS